MDNDTFGLYLKYHFATCEREDLAGITSHAIDIFKNNIDIWVCSFDHVPSMNSILFMKRNR